MAKTAYPTGIDLWNYLQSSKLINDSISIDSSSIDPEQAINSAINEWENDTNYIPFLAESVDSTLYYNPPGTEIQASQPYAVGGLYNNWGWMGGSQRLFLNTGYVSVTSITRGLTPTNSTGTVLTADRDYWLYPVNAPNTSTPYRYIEFAITAYGVPKSIKIIGTRGYSNIVPDDAWNAIIYKAAREVLPALEIQLTHGLSKIKQGPLELSYGTSTSSSPYLSMFTQWEKQINRAVGRYSYKGIY